MLLSPTGPRRRTALRLLAVSAASAFALLLAAVLCGCTQLLLISPPATPAAPTAKPISGGPREVQRPYQFPEKPLTVLVGSERGTTPDLAMRLLSPPLERLAGFPVVVANRTGAEAWTQLKWAKADGHILGLVASPQFLMPFDGWERPPFGVGDFAFLAGQLQKVGALFVGPQSPFGSARELVAAARAQPGTLSVAVPLEGTAEALALAELQKRAGVRLRVLPFADAVQAHGAVVRGEADAGFGSAVAVARGAAMGRGRLVAVLGESRLLDLPEVPTLREQGIDVISYSALGYAVPRATSPEVAEYLAWVLYLAISDPGHRGRMEEAGLPVSYMTGQQYRAFLTAEAERVKLLLPASP